MFEYVSIRDIARRAGVGVSTVSRVLNDHPETSQQTREKVLRIIREVNYRPNSRARQLVKNTAETICFILNNRDVINPFHSRVLMGVARYARTLAKNVIFMQFDYPPDAPPNRLIRNLGKRSSGRARHCWHELSQFHQCGEGAADSIRRVWQQPVRRSSNSRSSQCVVRQRRWNPQIYRIPY